MYKIKLTFHDGSSDFIRDGFLAVVGGKAPDKCPPRYYESREVAEEQLAVMQPHYNNVMSMEVVFDAIPFHWYHISFEKPDEGEDVWVSDTAAIFMLKREGEFWIHWADGVKQYPSPLSNFCFWMRYELPVRKILN